MSQLVMASCRPRHCQRVGCLVRPTDGVPLERLKPRNFIWHSFRMENELIGVILLLESCITVVFLKVHRLRSEGIDSSLTSSFSEARKDELTRK
jgi:hypothetical protein